MSFSMGGRYKTKEEALAQLTEYFDNVVVKGQPTHAHDRDAVLGATETYLGLVDQKPDHELRVSVNGNLSTQGPSLDAPEEKTSCSVAGVSISVGQEYVPA